MYRRNRRGFTLIELLVVIGIVGVLVVIVLPSLSRARAQSKQLKCAANLHQIGISLEIYAGTYDDWYPNWSNWHVWGFYGTEQDGTGDDFPGPAWTERLASDKSLPDKQIYECPSFPPEVEISYFLSAYAAWERHELRATRRDWIKYSSMFVLGGECTNPFFYAPPFGDSHPQSTNDADMDDASQPCIDWSNAVHSKATGNILFADGHVVGTTGFDPREMTFDTYYRGVSWGGISSSGG
jgi:prepilin-type N-terminal cleavage/methylation domain-containing protein/prepilin-type processing-associated H-X9-DG protein